MKLEDREKYRKEILELLSKYKVNKNWYSRGFFEIRGVGYLFDIMHHDWFADNEDLKNARLAQKLYHIRENDNTIPPTKFVNLAEGYLKGKRGSGYNKRPNSINYKSLDWLLNEVENNHEYNANDCLTDTEFDLVEFKNDLKYGRHKKMFENKRLLNFLLKNSNNQSLNLKYYIYSLKCDTTPHCPYCGNIKNIFNRKFGSTCESKICASRLLSEIMSKRDMSYLRTPEVRAKVSARLKNRPLTEEHKRKSSESNKKFWTPERKRKQTELNRKNGSYIKMSNTMKNKILEGSFTPNTTNRLTHKNLLSEITGLKYRSSWERSYHENHPHLLYEQTRIEYYDGDKRRIYIVDFTDHINKILYEIKPLNLVNNETVLLKDAAAKKWCLENGYTFQTITEEDYDF